MNKSRKRGGRRHKRTKTYKGGCLPWDRFINWIKPVTYKKRQFPNTTGISSAKKAFEYINPVTKNEVDARFYRSIMKKKGGTKQIKKTRRTKKTYKGGCKKITDVYDWIINTGKELLENRK